MTMPPPHVTNLLAALRTIVPRPGPEAVLALDVQTKLRAEGYAVSVEHQLKMGRVDLRVGSTAIELKVKGSIASVFRQLEMYAADPSVENIVLVTSSAKHRAMPPLSKPLFVVYLPRL